MPNLKKAYELLSQASDLIALEYDTSPTEELNTVLCDLGYAMDVLSW